MCGIVAIFTPSPNPKVASWIGAATDLIKHRGPDSQGAVFSSNNFVTTSPEGKPVDWGLGHARLAILGLGEQGHQPMASVDNSCWVVFNGEIYNFIELRNELKKLGYQVKGDSDTAVLLAAWSAWGVSCVEHFNGMFAFVLVDTEKNVAFAARDRLGIKPLYYWKGSIGIALVSEIKQLAAIPEFIAKGNLQQIQDFLIDGVSGHEQETFFDGVASFPAAHRLLWKLGTRPNIDNAECWWQLERSSSDMSWSDAVEGTRQQLIRAVTLRMRSDVPVGSCLSGGIDSSSIVSIVTKQLGESIRTFSSCSHNPLFDEQQYIDTVNKDTNSVSTKVFPNESEAIELFDTIAWHQDEPFGSLSIYAQWCVMKLARENNVPVLLDGQGGDEIFCGYRKYVFFYLQHLLNRRKYIASLRHTKDMLLNGDRRIFDLRAGTRYMPNCFRERIESPIKISGALLPYKRHPWGEKMSGIKSIELHRSADLLTWSLPTLLRYEDRSSMAHGVEARVPFVDHNLIEFALTIPEQHLFRQGRGKAPLVDAMEGILAESIRKRRTKMGFESPQSVWMKGEFGKYSEDRIRSCNILEDWIDVDHLCDNTRVNNRNWDTLQKARFRVASVVAWIDRFGISS